ncbi:HNH endonuclease [Massilia suwonensis]|uniref:HNH endonuclease n=1 Tax=Massilia suwonensis TaxID=648895 RepID=A0ABW0MQP4_9BURK
MAKNINDLTSRDAVKAAIAECDELGREQFLAKYGYRYARTYALMYKGREYDSKAIAGVAYGKQFGAAMRPREHSGGVNYCVPVLQKLGFKVRGALATDTAPKAKSTKNPIWNRDELMLALHLYLHNRKSPPGKTSAKVIELSELLGRMSKHSKTTDTYRNPTGVSMKLMNFRSLDPLYTSAGKVGLSKRNKDELVVWKLYADKLDYLDSLVAQITAAVDHDVGETGIHEDDEVEIEDCEEGRVLTRMHRFRERNRKLAADFKKKYRKLHGKLDCAGCDDDFADKYGSLADSLVDVHHTKPIHTLKPGDKTSAKDLVLLCASCHRAVHAQKYWLSIAELRQKLGKSAPREQLPN